MRIKTNTSLKPYSTMGFDSIGEIIYFPETIDDIIKLMKEFDNYIILGSGSNTVFAEHIKTPIINTSLLNKITMENNELRAQCGVLNSKLQKIAQKEKYTDLLCIYGIPGTIGGAVFGNASIFKNKFIFNTIKNIRSVNKQGEIEIIRNFSPIYRKGNISNFIYEITFDLSSQPELFNDTLKRVKLIREKQPKGKSVGSVFKNPKDRSAGYLIDQCGLKGKKSGGIKISEKHGNFFMNEKNGNYKDFIKLIELTKKRVWERFNIHLELEVKIVEK